MSLSNLRIPEIKKELKPLSEIHWIKRTIDPQENFIGNLIYKITK